MKLGGGDCAYFATMYDGASDIMTENMWRKLRNITKKEKINLRSCDWMNVLSHVSFRQLKKFLRLFVPDIQCSFASIRQAWLSLAAVNLENLHSPCMCVCLFGHVTGKDRHSTNEKPKKWSHMLAKCGIEHSIIHQSLVLIHLPRFTGIDIYNVWFNWCFFCHPVWDDLKL